MSEMVIDSKGKDNCVNLWGKRARIILKNFGDVICLGAAETINLNVRWGNRGMLDTGQI